METIFNRYITFPGKRGPCKLILADGRVIGPFASNSEYEIEPYEEKGQGAAVTWFAIIERPNKDAINRGEVIGDIKTVLERVNSAHVISVFYREPLVYHNADCDTRKGGIRCECNAT